MEKNVADVLDGTRSDRIERIERIKIPRRARTLSALVGHSHLQHVAKFTQDGFLKKISGKVISKENRFTERMLMVKQFPITIEFMTL